MSFRLRYIGGVDARLKSEIVALGKWIRESYQFPTTLEIRLINEKVLIDLDGTKCYLRYWQSSRGAEPVMGLIAVGSFAQTLKSKGPTWAYPTVIAAIGRVLKYYYQMVRDAPLREDYATLWGDKFLDAYVEESTPPEPWRGARTSPLTFVVNLNRRSLGADAKEGNPLSQCLLGGSYEFDYPRNRHLARRWYLAASEQGLRGAQWSLAMLHEEDGEHAQAAYWYRLAAEQGDRDAQLDLACCLRDGQGVPRNRRKAFEWFVKAAEQGEHEAQLGVGHALYHGEGIKRDREAALGWFRRAAQNGNAWAKFNIGCMYANGDVVEQSWPRAIAWFRKAAAGGNVVATHWLGRIYNGSEGHPENSRAAVRWLSQAADEGDARSQCDLGVRYFHGQGVTRDQAKAAGLYRAAADQDDSRACYLLGLAYREGNGVRRNRRHARAWFQKAADMGEDEAARDLAALDD